MQRQEAGAVSRLGLGLPILLIKALKTVLATVHGHEIEGLGDRIGVLPRRDEVRDDSGAAGGVAAGGVACGRSSFRQPHKTTAATDTTYKPRGMSELQPSLRPGGFGPSTSGLGNRCSILLSYGRVVPKSLYCNHFSPGCQQRFIREWGPATCASESLPTAATVAALARSIRSRRTAR